MDSISILKIQRGIILANMMMELCNIFSVHILIMIYTKFHENIFDGFKVDTISIPKNNKDT